MKTKKLKRKKLKCKKTRKLQSAKKEKNVLIESCNKSDDGENLSDKNSHNRLPGLKYSRSCTEQKDVSDVKYFSEIREGYFRYLQTVVSDNCVFCDSVVTDEVLENLALELEQNALLACLQVDIYKKSMLKIIRDIKKCTEEKQVHEEVWKLLPGSLEEKMLPTTNFQVDETYSKIPTISSIRTDDNLGNNSTIWEEQLNYPSDSYYSVVDPEFTKNQMDTNPELWIENKTYTTVTDNSNYWKEEAQQANNSNISASENSKFTYSDQFSVKSNSIIYSDIKNENFPDQNKEKIDPLLLSRNQLQKLVEQTLDETEKINKQKRDEQEKAYIAQILEGDDSLDEKFNDSLSDNDNESKENIDETNLMDRLEKMRELFGMEEEVSQSETVSEKPKPYNKVNHVNTHSRRPTIWRYEKFIQLHKYSIIAAEMSFQKRQINRKVFLDLFGDDSDEEHENEYSSTEKYRACCTERISSWVVKYLMPFYHEKRIVGRNVFKSLGHYVSDTIVDKIQYPDEWTVKYMVSKFFPPKKKYVCESDIVNFQPNW